MDVKTLTTIGSSSYEIVSEGVVKQSTYCLLVMKIPFY